MKPTSLTRRVLAGAASLALGATGALAFAAPAAAQDGDPGIQSRPVYEWSADLVGEAMCDDIETGTWDVEWTLTNTSMNVQKTPDIIKVVSDGDVFEDDGEGVGDIVVGAELPTGSSLTGTQTFPGGTESTTLKVELKWDYPHRFPVKDQYRSAEYMVELGDCDVPPPPPPPAPPNLVVASTCELLVFLIDNAEGEGEVVVTLTPDRTATHGHASGFSYTLLENDEVEVEAEEDAGIHEELGEADADNPVVLGEFPAGAELHAHAFEGVEDLVVTLSATVDGEPLLFTEDELDAIDITWDVEGLDCDDEGEGGELPATGLSTGLIAGGAVALVVAGGAIYLVARRRRITFTAA